METISDFCKWAGTQRKAAELLGISESKVSRLANGRLPVSKDLAELVEAVSGGVFRKERVLWPATTEAANKADSTFARHLAASQRPVDQLPPQPAEHEHVAARPNDHEHVRRCAPD